MAEWTTIPIGTKCYRPRSGTTSIERLVNRYAEPSQEGGKTPVTLYPTPGLLAWTTVGDGPIRGMYAFQGDVYVVSGTKLYAVDHATKTATEIGDVAGVGAVRMLDNGSHVVIATNGHLYAANRTTILDLPQQNICGIAYQDGYLIYAQRGTENFWLSGLDDATTIDALDFSTVDVVPDNVVGCISNRRELFLFGTSSIEAWINTGAAAFPFERAGGGYIERGCASPGSIAKALGQVYWLGDNRIVYRNVGYQEQPISTSDVERLIADAADPASSEAFVYTQAGHTFYCLSFSDLSLVYDITTGLWHERLSFGETRWRVGSYCTTNDLHLAGDFESNEIYELDLDTYSDDGDPIVRQIVFPPLSDGARHIFVPEMFVDIEAGSDAGVIQLQWSEDDGRTWVGSMNGSLGATGAYRHRLTFNRLGRFSNRTFRLQDSDAVKSVILGAQARIEVGL